MHHAQTHRKLNLAILAACVLYVLTVAFSQAVEVELKEDFSGKGDTQIESNYYGQSDKISVRNAQNFVYGHSWVEGNSFSGLKATGQEINYFVTNSAHSLKIMQASSLNVTAKIQSQVESEGNKTLFSYYTASGNGTVRELAQQPGKFNRPADLASLWHRGSFKLNSSMKVVT